MIAIPRYGFVLLAAWSIGATCAWSSEDSADSPSELQEVVVTAQRSVSGLQTTPLAVTALSGPDSPHAFTNPPFFSVLLGRAARAGLEIGWKF
jgi:hypothetical protein